MSQTFIGSKQIKGFPESKGGVDGYRVIYPDGYESWSPAQQFQEAYLCMGDNCDDASVNQAMVDAMIGEIEAVDFDEKTTLVKATLVTGFTIIKTSACVDPGNYDRAIGEALCLDKIKAEIWSHLGFALQWARFGLDNTATKGE